MSIPLINDSTAKKNIKKELKDLDKCFFNVKIGMGTNKFACYTDTEEKIDEIVSRVQEVLQKEKYFMPAKTDPRYGWKEG